MVELLSITSAAAVVGSRILTRLNQFINKVRSTPSSIQSLAREVQELCLVLERLEIIFKDREPNQKLSLDLRVVINSCMDNFTKLEQLVQVHKIKDDEGKISQQLKCWRWAFQETQVAALKDQLEENRVALSDFLIDSIHEKTTAVQNITGRIGGAVWEIAEQLILQEEEKNAAAKYAPRYTLQKCASEPSRAPPSPRASNYSPGPSASSGYRPAQPRRTNFGDVVQVRREMRLVCRRSAKARGSTFWI